MATLYLLSILIALGAVLVPVCYWGERLFGDRAIGAIALCIFASTALLGLEHYVALPGMALTAAAIGLALYGLQQLKQRQLGELKIRALIVLILFFAYPLLWRWAFPSISPSSERVTNLFFISHFVSDQLLPAIDRWFPPYAFDFYYPLQYYWAGLLVRTLKIPPGYAYNLGAVVLMGAAGYLIWHTARAATGSRLRAALIAFALLLCGSGAAPYIAYSISQHTDIDPGHVTLRAISADARYNGAGGFELQLPPPPANASKPPELPLEPFAYQFFLGDFHPTLSGLLIGFLLVALMIAYERPSSPSNLQKRLGFCLGALSIIAIAANTWIFPLATLWTGFWTLWKLGNIWIQRRQGTQTADALGAGPLLISLIAGGAAATVAILPVLKGLSARQLQTPMLMVTSELHSQLLPWLLQWGPIVGLAIVAVMVLPKRSLGVFFAVSTLLLLAFSELVYVNDLSVAQYERTNSVLKWWGWIWSVSLFGLTTAIMSRGGRTGVLAVSILLLPGAVSAYWYAKHWFSFNPQEAGRLDGTFLYTRDAAQRGLIDRMQRLPQGVVLESIAGNAYTDTGVLTLFGEQSLYMGWPDHEYTWRGGLSEIATRVDEIGKFYKREMHAPTDWLLSQNIDYVLWTYRDCQTYTDKGVWEINDRIKDRYHYRIAGWTGTCAVGMWTRQER